MPDMGGSGQGMSFSRSPISLIDFLDGGSGAAGWRSTAGRGATGESTGHSSHTAHVRHAAGALVELGDDGIAHALQLLLLVVEFFLLGQSVGVEPILDFLAFLEDGFFVFVGNLVLELLILDGGLHVEAVRFETVLGGDLLSLGLVLLLVFLGVVDHLFDVLFRKTSLVVGDGNLVLFAGGFVAGRDVEDTIFSMSSF